MGAGQVDVKAMWRSAAEALRMCLAGDEAKGLALYRSIALPAVFRDLPLGLHVHTLREQGRDAAAEALAALTIRYGGDLAWKAGREGVAPEAAVADYAAYVARGQVNPQMVIRYLQLLTQLGRTEEVAAIFDPARLIQAVRIPGGDAVAEALLALEDQGIAVDAKLSVRSMRQIPKLKERAQFAPLLAACRAETEAYYARWAASDHPLTHAVPRDFSISAWGLISRGEGYNVRHQHPVGWATGVYYPAGLDAGIAGGSLCIGGWEDPAPPGWPEARIRPEAGLLVLIPSYYVHWTEPLGVPGLRLSVAYDAIPDEKGPGFD